MSKYILFLIFIFNSSCANIFEPAGDKTTDAAIYEDALKALNSSDWNTAISKFQSLRSSDYTNSATVKMNYAGAYAGRCGFNFASYITILGSASLAGTTLFKFFMNQWTASTTARADCRSAEDIVKTITPTYVGRDSSQSLFMVLLGMAKIGIYLRELTDLSPIDGIADDPPFDVTIPTDGFCVVGNGVDGYLTNAQVADIGAGLGMVIANLTNVGTALSGSSLDLSGINLACALLTPNPCLVEDEAAFLADPNMLKSIRSLLNTSGAPLSTGLVAGTICL